MQHITVERPPGRAWALVKIAKEPVNSFDTDLWAALRDALAALEADETVRGAVIASGLKRDVFTAGNDINELYAPNTSPERCARFCVASFVSSRLFASSLRSRLVSSRLVFASPLFALLLLALLRFGWRCF